MTPQEKAKRLVFEFEKITLPMTSIIATDEVCGEAKKCALICVDEIYKLNQLKVGRYEGERDIEMYYSYWEDVKQEIEKI